ncbi:serine hydrolase [Streptococcus caprae]|uniref:Serine hydrolase n=1 Tax=Streptococcus caprae TaxID=1640501 RepID=A0ABV8CVA5_9STRE
MKKWLAILLATGFVMPFSIISSEVDVHITNQTNYELSENLASVSTYFAQIPTKPVLTADTVVYKDVNLSELAKVLKPGTKQLDIDKLVYNDSGLPVFELSDGTYLEANQGLIYDDIIYNQQEFETSFYLLPDFKVYDKPYTLGAKLQSSSLKAYDKVTVTQQAETHAGLFYYVDGSGWISEEFLTSEDVRMQAVQDLLETKYKKSNLSVYVKSMVTQETAEINADKTMYAASVAKLATLYYTQEQVDTGNLNWNDKVKYIKETEDYDGAYESYGIDGGLPFEHDDKEYTLETLAKAISQVSDNAAANILGYYATEKYGKDFQASLKSTTGQTWDMKTRQVSAKTAGQLMEAIYYQDGQIIDYLSNTKFDNERISKTIPVQVAHKIGDAYEFRHDVAFVYADEPFVLSIFTENSSYDEISQIAQDIYVILN